MQFTFLKTSNHCLKIVLTLKTQFKKKKIMTYIGIFLVQTLTQ